jgi:hypothetical protein
MIKADRKKNILVIIQKYVLLNSGFKRVLLMIAAPEQVHARVAPA